MHDLTKKFIGGLLLLGTFWLKDWFYAVEHFLVLIIYIILAITALLLILNPKGKK